MQLWFTAVGTILPCQQEGFNPHDSYAVAIIKDDVVVGHVPRNMYMLVAHSTFLRRGGVSSVPSFFKRMIWPNLGKMLNSRYIVLHIALHV